jgi:hypothetical protein
MEPGYLMRLLREHLPSAMKARDATAELRDSRRQNDEWIEFLRQQVRETVDSKLAGVLAIEIEFHERFSAKLDACIFAVECVPEGIPLFMWEATLMAHNRRMMRALPSGRPWAPDLNRDPVASRTPGGRAPTSG